jgi:hypothetical protein
MPYINFLIEEMIEMRLKSVEFEQVVNELRILKKKLGNGQNLAWVRFSYNKQLRNSY